MPQPDLEGLRREAHVFARYLVDRAPPPELVDRYAEANRVLLGGAVPARDSALVAFVHRHAWSVPFLDAASALLAPDSLLRSKILVMAAVLEASPTFAEEFLPRPSRPAALVIRVLLHGAVAVACAVLGVLLFGLAIRSRAGPG